MAMIKVKQGACGINYTDEHGKARHTVKSPEDKPFEVDDVQAARFVNLGVAEYVSTLKAEDVTPADEQEEKAEAAQETVTGVAHLSTAELELMDFNELKRLAADMGVKPSGKKKADYVAAIAAVEVEHGPEIDPDDEDDLPELSAADPE